MDKQYTNIWFEERGGKTWDKLLHKRRIDTALEIGCYEGQASVWLLNKFKNLNLTVIDIFDASVAEDWDGYTSIDNEQATTYEQRFDNNVKEYGDRVTKYKGKSFEYLAQEICVGNKYDFIFVDGDHRGLPAMQDCVMSLELLAEGGIMIIDDYNTNIPWLTSAVNAFAELLPKDKYKTGTTPDGQQFIVKRIK